MGVTFTRQCNVDFTLRFHVRTIAKVLLAVLFSVPAFSQAVDLDRGHFEINGFGGAMMDVSTIFGSTKKGGGVEAAFGINRYMAATADYSFSSGKVDAFCIFTCIVPDEHIQEFMGGVRLSLPNHTRLTPYATGTVGGLHFTTSSSTFGPSPSTTNFALGIGLGVDIRVARRVGILLDLRGIDATSPGQWFVRSTAGLYFRF